MGNEADWNTFTRTGKVSDYLTYARSENQSTNYMRQENDRQEARRQRERASDGNSAFGSYHW